MKTKIISLLLLFVIKSSLGQIIYEKGYFIDNFNKKTECLIKNNDWNNNPSKFIYKLRDDDTAKIGTISSVKEFCVYGYAKYIRAFTEIERSSNYIDHLSSERNPIWSKEVLFLKQLVKGTASLYQYKNAGLEKFFYSSNDTIIKQLVYKKYIIGKNGINGAITNDDKIAENDKFRQQLWSYVKCDKASENSIKRMNFSQNELEKYFMAYNKCIGDSSVFEGTKKQKKSFFNFKFTTGINYSSLKATYIGGIIDQSTIFKKNISTRIGFEAEFILPFNKNKWSVIIEPSFQYYNSKSTFNEGINHHKTTVKYKSIEYPIGLRYYIYLNKNSKLFLNTLMNFTSSIDMNSEIDLNFMKLKTRDGKPTFLVGAGLSYKRLSGEIRYINKDIIIDYLLWQSEFKRYSFILSYKLL